MVVPMQAGVGCRGGQQAQPGLGSKQPAGGRACCYPVSPPVSCCVSGPPNELQARAVASPVSNLGNAAAALARAATVSLSIAHACSGSCRVQQRLDIKYGDDVIKEAFLVFTFMAGGVLRGRCAQL